MEKKTAIIIILIEVNKILNYIKNKINTNKHYI